MNYLEGLTEEQKMIVSYSGGPMVVEAIPGSGKTHTIVRLAAKLFSENPQLSKNPTIRMITFTNKASLEAKERLEKLVGEVASRSVSTFHRLAIQIYRNDPDTEWIWPSNSTLDKNGIRNEKLLKMFMYRWDKMGVTTDDVIESWNTIVNSIESYEEFEETYMMLTNIQGFVINDIVEFFKRRKMLPLDLCIPIAVSI